MGFLYGFVGAVLGSFLGVGTAILDATISQDGHTPDAIFEAMEYSPFFLGCGAVLGIFAARFLLRYVRSNSQDGQAKRRNARMVTGLILAVCVTTAVMLWVAQRYTLAPSDQRLIRNFEHHRAAFDTLIQMSKSEKGYVRVSSQANAPDELVETDMLLKRVSEYRRLLSTMEINRLTAGPDTEEGYGANLSFWGQDSGHTEHTDKGYAYFTVPPKDLLRSLDDFEPDEYSDKTVYRHLQGDWYLYYSHSPD